MNCLFHDSNGANAPYSGTHSGVIETYGYTNCLISNCGKNIGPDTYSTLGEERKNNYALLAGSKEEFIKAVTDGLNTPPQYFAVNARINKEGYESLDEVMDNGLKPLSLEDFKKLINEEDAICLDTRISSEFAEGFVPGSISIGLDGRFAEWAGSLLPFDKPFVLVTEPGKEKESVVRLARVATANGGVGK